MSFLLLPPLTMVLKRDPKLYFVDIKSHRTKEDYALARVTTLNCIDPTAVGNCYYSVCILSSIYEVLTSLFQVYLTTDFGTTWKVIQTYTAGFDWGEGDQIWIETWKNKQGEQTWNRWDCFLTKSIDLGVSFVDIMPHVGGFIMKFQTLFIAQVFLLPSMHQLNLVLVPKQFWWVGFVFCKKLWRTGTS